MYTISKVEEMGSAHDLIQMSGKPEPLFDDADPFSAPDEEFDP